VIPMAGFQPTPDTFRPLAQTPAAIEPCHQCYKQVKNSASDLPSVMYRERHSPATTIVLALFSFSLAALGQWGIRNGGSTNYTQNLFSVSLTYRFLRLYESKGGDLP
jgi:hypothetical protein